MIKTILAILITTTILIGNGKPTSQDRKIINLGLNYEFNEADRLLAEEFNKTESLKNHFLFLNLELLKVMKSTDEVPFKYKKGVKDSLNQIMITYAEEIIEQYEDEDLSLYDQFYFGSIHGLLGRLYGVSGEMMSAFSSGKEGRNIMEDIVEKDSNFTDAYLLMGMMNYYADRLGGFIEFVAGILGLSGNRNIGLQYLEKVEKEGDINNWQATMILIELYSRMEGNKFQSLPLLEKIVKRFPNNSHFKNWLCYEYINLHHLKSAGNMILLDIENFINDFVKASYFHQAGEYDKSNEIYNNLLGEEGLIWPWVYENAKYVRVLNYFYLGDKEKAEKLSAGLNEKYLAQFQKIMETPELISDIVEFRKAVVLGEEETINRFIETPPDFSTSNSAEASYNYYAGVYHFNENRLNEAEQFFLKAKNLSFEDFGDVTARYLIHIYKTNEVTIEKVEQLLDDIDDLDNNSLEFFAQDLEEKYDL